ncbi:hypothetical protein CE456_00760 (plasmid) [Aeromonas salmonicida]|uniref:hypothetical protein n=1 Tax=Aeromonas salmonicida TaxID=645 RepID=UPI000B594227|nr:hypothetical protein [Aeromonas salmonicida]ASI21407.1 hypothetical protein CE456_00760 [Aeromonas salmonicida]
MKRIAIALPLSLALAACGDTQEKQQRHKPPEDRWKKITLNQYGEVVPNESEPSTAAGVDK